VNIVHFGEAAYGNFAEAQRLAEDGLRLASTSQSSESEAGLAFALAGNSARAESLVQDSERRFPLNTQIQSLWLREEQLALDRGKRIHLTPRMPCNLFPCRVGSNRVR
jgi:hypothetical protein